MFGNETINLPNEENKSFYYDKIKIERLLKEIDELLNNSLFIKSDKYNNLLLNPERLRLSDDTIIKNIDKVYNYIDSTEKDYDNKNRLYNIYLANRFISSKTNINIDTLKDLYRIVSNKIVDNNDDSMGDYYRKKREFILESSTSLLDFIELVKPNNVDYYMDQLLTYINTNNSDLNDINKFIKSQIISLYFVYVHPYLDTNGRMSRLLSSWYLINNNDSKYLLFNKVLINNRDDYIKSVKKSIKTKNITHFLLFIIKGLKEEINKQSIIYDIDNKNNLSIEEIQIIDTLLSVKDKIKIKDLILIYNNYKYNPINDSYVSDRIVNLIDKNIIIEDGEFIYLNYNNNIVNNKRRL